MNLETEQLDLPLESLNSKPKELLYLFRALGPSIREGLPQSLDLKGYPKVFLHGNPHLENFRQTVGGVGLLDFDRSRRGPYVWDAIRFLGSLMIFSDAPENKELYKKAIESFSLGYERSAANTSVRHALPSLFTRITPQKGKTLVTNYADARYKWLKKLKKNQLKGKKYKKALEMLDLFLSNRSEEFLLEQYYVHSIGESVGSFGKKHILFWLKDKSKKRQPLLIDLKETYYEPDDLWFSNPFHHSGQRMVESGMLYGSSLEQRVGYFTYEENDYWGREIPAYSLKVPFLLNKTSQEDLAFVVGSQLGKAHALSIEEQFKPEDLISHWTENKKEAIRLVEDIHSSILKLHKKAYTSA